jgi:hypothetical protein
MVLLSAQGVDVDQIVKVAFSSPDRVRELLHNLNDDGSASLDPKYAGVVGAELHSAPAPGDQEDRSVAPGLHRADFADGQPSFACTAFVIFSLPTTSLLTVSMAISRPTRVAASFWLSRITSAVSIRPGYASGSCGTTSGASQDAQGQPQGPTSPNLCRGQQHRVGLRRLLRHLAQPHQSPVTALRHFALDGTDHETDQVQARMVRRFIAWRNRHARDVKLQQIVRRANVA